MHTATRKLLTDAHNEKDVESAYRTELAACIPGVKITSPFGSDGYAEFDTVRALLEFKYDWDLKHKSESCRALTQLVFYLKKFEVAGSVLPNVLFVGDKNECFALGTGSVQRFLDMKIDWSTPPSAGNEELTRALVADTDITPFVFNVDEELNFQTVLDTIRALSVGEVRKIRATSGNIGAMFAYWSNEVFSGSGLTPVEQVDVFLKCLFGSGAYIHPNKNLLVIGGQEIPIKVGLYKSFFTHFEQGYKPTEIEAFYAQKDRLVEDDARRRQGAYFTPTAFVNEAHKMIEGVLGANWRDECIVWDSSAGTGNLTRDYVFKDLILSTAEKPDVDVIRSQGYNPGADVFQYDFLNPGIDSPFFPSGSKNVLPDSVVEKLQKASMEGKRLVWFGNPPYGTAGVQGTTDKAGIALTATNGNMKNAKLGACSQQLYAQFMFQFNQVAQDFGFKEVTIALFSVPTFMSSGSYKPFRNWWYGKFAYQAGMLFQASHFADVSGRWGISFTIWNEGRTDGTRDLLVALKDLQNFSVVKTGMKAVYNSNGREASKWVRGPGKSIDAPTLSSGLTVKNTGKGSLIPGALSFFGNDSNSLVHSGALVYMVSSADTHNHGLSVLPTNFRRALALYGARKLVTETWDTQKDEYLVPDTTNPTYEQWVDDCHVYAMLHNSNNCTSMRNVSYANKLWTIHNHFFWKTHAETLQALDTPATGNLYRDCKNHPAKDVFDNPVVSTPDPYLAHVLPGLNLSPEAKDVLAKLDALWVKSLPVREVYSQEHPELHLGAWGCGIYQLKHLFRDLFPTDWENLQASFKVLGNKLRPGVYEYGFLKA